MKIEFCVSGVDSSEEECRHMALVVAKYAEDMGIEFQSIDEVIVATQDRFGEVVRRFDPSGMYTNSHGLLAAGKTFTRRSPEGVISNSILLQYDVVRQILDGPFQHGKDFQTWPPEAQRSLYVLIHELGHCLDHTQRTENEDDGTYRTEAGERAARNGLKNISTYQTSILLNELAACMHAASAYTDGVRALDCQMNNEFVRVHLNDLARRTIETPSALGDIRREGIGLFWFILFQHAKFVGAKVGNPSLASKTAAQLWDIAGAASQIADVLAIAEQTMEKASQTYPDFGSEIFERLSECFAKVAAISGYKFQDSTGLDGVWWDFFIQRAILRKLAGVSSFQ